MSTPAAHVSRGDNNATKGAAGASGLVHAAPVAAVSTGAPKPRSCITCRQRKVRCDKLSPCSNCRRADIPCTLPSMERPPRWARRLKQQQQQQQGAEERGHVHSSLTQSASAAQSPLSPLALGQHVLPSANPVRALEQARGSPPSGRDQGISVNPADVGAVIDRLRHLETLVRDLNGGMPGTGLPGPSSVVGASPLPASPSLVPSSTTSAAVPVQEQFGRLILDDTSGRSRYIGSGFWSRINDELDKLRAQTANLADSGHHNDVDDGWSTGDGDDDDGDSNDSNGSNTGRHTLLDPSATASTTATVVLPLRCAMSEAAHRSAAERNAFLFGHNLQPALGDVSDYRPLPPHIPFLFQVYLVNVNVLGQVVHAPTMNKIISGLLGETMNMGVTPPPLSPAREALMFAIYYAAVVSMEDDDVVKNFAMPASDLSLKYRIGLELSLAKADFLNTVDLEIVQALVIFIMLCRRYDSPRFVWMMTGILIRMALALGLQRDGSNFGASLTPYEIEIRRRVWWAICAIDVRAAEDQGSDLTILPDAFDTRLPLNINDGDIAPDGRAEPVAARDELTDMTYALVNYEVTRLAQSMMAAAAAAARQPDGLRSPQLLQQQNAMLTQVNHRLESVYLRHSPDTTSVLYWTSVTVTRIFLAKMTLILNLPRLLHEQNGRDGASGAPNDEELRTRLLSSAIDVAEYNDALKTERACRRWRWLCETYTQWHAIAFLLIETGQRPWDPAVERAWVALHSPYLIPKPPPQPPSQAPDPADADGVDNTKRCRNDSGTQFFWLPLRRLLARARRHRTTELARLRADAKAARALEIAYDMAVADGRSRPLSNPGAIDAFRNRWRQLVGLTDGPGGAAADAVDAIPSGGAASRPPLAHDTLRAFGDLTEKEYKSARFPLHVPPAALAPNNVGALLVGSKEQGAQQPQMPSPSQPPGPSRRGTSATSLSQDELRARARHPLNSFDPWTIWNSDGRAGGGSGGGSNQVDASSDGISVSPTGPGGSSSGIYSSDNAPRLFDEDLDMDLDLEPAIDWDDWFASAKAFE